MEREEGLRRKREQYRARGNRDTIEERWLEAKRVSKRCQRSTLCRSECNSCFLVPVSFQIDHQRARSTSIKLVVVLFNYIYIARLYIVNLQQKLEIL